METEDIYTSPMRLQNEHNIHELEESETVSVMRDVREYEPNLGMLDPQNLKDWLEGNETES